MSTVQFARTRTAPQDLEKPMPQNVEAERSILGAILLDNKALLAAAEKVNTGSFFHDHHQRIYRAMVEMHDLEQPIDLVTLTEYLQKKGELEAIGGAAYVSQLMDGVPHTSNVAHYAQIVHEKSLLREVIHTMSAVQQKALNELGTAAEISVELDQYAKHLAKSRQSGLVAVDVREFLIMNLEPLEYVIEPLLTAKGRGMIYAPRGAGKTFVTMQIAYAIAAGTRDCFVWNVPQKRPVVYVDGEMHSSMLQERQREIFKINGGDPPEPGFLRLITRDLQKDVRPKINTPTGRDHIEAHLSKGDVLILDNLSALSPSSDEKETEDWAIIEDWLSDLSWHGISTMFVNHSGKSGDQRGTSKREDLLDFVLKLRVPSDHTMDEGLRAEMHLTKLRGKSPQPAWGQPFEVRLGMDEVGGLTWMTRPLKELLRERARQMLADGMKANDVVLETGLSRWSVARIARGLKFGPGAESGNTSKE